MWIAKITLIRLYELGKRRNSSSLDVSDPTGLGRAEQPIAHISPVPTLSIPLLPGGPDGAPSTAGGDT